MCHKWTENVQSQMFRGGSGPIEEIEATFFRLVRFSGRLLMEFVDNISFPSEVSSTFEL